MKINNSAGKGIPSMGYRGNGMAQDTSNGGDSQATPDGLGGSG